MPSGSVCVSREWDFGEGFWGIVMEFAASTPGSGGIGSPISFPLAGSVDSLLSASTTSIERKNFMTASDSPVRSVSESPHGNPLKLERPIFPLFREEGFIGFIHGFEQLLARVMAIALVVVLVLAVLQLLWMLGHELLDPAISWYGDDLIRLLDQVLVILIALEVMQNLTAYLRDHVVQIELVLVTALTALGRKVIVMPPDLAGNPLNVIGIGIGAVTFAIAYWLVRQSHTVRAPSLSASPRSAQESGPSAVPDIQSAKAPAA